MARRSIISTSLKQTQNFAKKLAKQLLLGDSVYFFGNLGAGKTTLIKTLISEMVEISPDEVTSPTFNYCQSYKHVHHFDLYRLQSSNEFLQLGLDELMNPGTICVCEWSERIQDIIPPYAWKIYIEVLKDKTRKITYETHSLSKRHI